MSDRNPYPPPSRPREDELTPAQGGENADHPAQLSETLAERLRALDHLYETKQITATELGEARRKILATAESSPAPPTPAAVDAGGQPPPPPPPRIIEDHIGAPPPPPDRRIAGLPPWAAAGIAAVLVVGAIAAVLIVLLAGGDEDGSADGAAGQAYANQIARPLDQLTSSAVATGKALARVSEPNEIRALNRAAERQLDLVEEARRRLSAISVTDTDRRAHGRLIAAAAAQRRYLVQLGRATSGTPTQASLAAANRARRAGAETLRAYRTFFALVPAAPDAITATDLSDTAGLRAAIQTSIASRDTADRGSPPPVTPSPSRAPTTYGGRSFQSPTGNLRCEDGGGVLFCSSSNDGFGVSLPAYGPPVTGSGIASGGVTVPYGSSWSSGVFSCDSAFDGITCRNGSGNGFFLNRDEYRSF